MFRAWGCKEKIEGNKGGVWENVEKASEGTWKQRENAWRKNLSERRDNKTLLGRNIKDKIQIWREYCWILKNIRRTYMLP